MNMVAKKSKKQKQVQFDFSGKACWVGVDVHKVSYAVAILDEDGQRLEFSTPADPKALLLQLSKMGMSIKILTHESGPTGYGLAWACQAAGIPNFDSYTNKYLIIHRVLQNHPVYFVLHFAQLRRQCRYPQFLHYLPVL